MAGTRHVWPDMDRFLAVHDSCIERVCSYFVDEPNIVAPDIITPGLFRFHGELICKGGLVIHIDNYLNRDVHNHVHGTVYRYQAQFIEPPLRQIFRYDNDHVYAREGHPDAFHKHIFSDRTWHEIEVQHVGRERFSTLLEVIDELYDWWLRKRDDPLIYP